MRVEKTGETVKVEPRYLPKLHRFILDFINWEPDCFLRYTGVNRIMGTDYRLFIEPDFLLIPAYSFYSIPDPEVIERLGVEPKHSEKIKVEDLLLHEVYKVVGGDSEFTIGIEVGMGMWGEWKKVKPWMIEVDFIIEPKYGYGTYYRYGTYLDINLGWYVDYINRLMGTGDKRPLKLNKIGILAINYLYNVERISFALLNFLYTLYMGTALKVDTVGYNLFRPYTELLRGYGNTFEEVLSSIYEVVILAS
jgi:hypothetical protein